MKVMSSLQDSESLNDSYGAQESCQEKVSHRAPLTVFKKVLDCQTATRTARQHRVSSDSGG